MTKIQEEIDRLQGSCDNLDIEDWSQEQLEELDSQIALCDCCGWWVESTELDDEGICEDCVE